ncbi:MAG: thiamine pyrophosphate-dependent dehydrogenase E1 component subunit alpha [Christensenellaceae bacterium]|jgi:TPP-dependent pyruvate/acetoin dehydrogenase alpha subunit
MELTENQYVEIYRKMYTARVFEERVYEMFQKKMIHGTTHLAIGQEATAVGAVAALDELDCIMSSHRGHAHSVAKGSSITEMMCELMGKDEGCCKGLGGSMHIVDRSKGNYGANGIIGPAIPLATGVALALKKDGDGRIILNFFGDGTSNSGLFHESLNMAALWKLPIIYFCENNQYGMSTHVSRSISVENVADRAQAYGIPSKIVDGMDVLAVMETTKKAADHVKSGAGPFFIEAKTYRYMGHSKSDHCNYRTREEEAEWKAKDPIDSFEKVMRASGIAQKTIQDLRAQVESECDGAVEYAKQAKVAKLETARKLMYA